MYIQLCGYSELCATRNPLDLNGVYRDIRRRILRQTYLIRSQFTLDEIIPRTSKPPHAFYTTDTTTLFISFILLLFSRHLVRMDPINQ